MKFIGNKSHWLTIALSFWFNILIFSQAKSKVTFSEILQEELKKHPRSNVEDIYKFIHQASFGSEHAVKDAAAARNWLENEIKSLDYTVTDELIDQLSVSGRLVRVNLRPYLKRGFDPTLLLDAFIKTANNFKGSEDEFRLFWNEAKKLAKTKKFSFSFKVLKTFFEEKEKEGFPAIHHSKKYTDEYMPSYRVVDLQYLPLLVK